jgi:hypothetical protein
VVEKPEEPQAPAETQAEAPAESAEQQQ